MVEINKDRLRGRRVIASVSGGKDSTAMCLLLREQGIEYDAVFMDTGWEHEDTLLYLREVLDPKIGPIRWLTPKRQFEELALHKGMMPSRFVRFCTQFLKVRPMQEHLKARSDETGEDVVNAVGIRASESAARAGLPEWEWSEGFDCEVWRPILRFSEQDVIETHHRHAVPPNPLYLRGARRVGCWPCVFATKDEIRLVADQDPDRIDRIRRLEEQMNEKTARAAQRRGEEASRTAFFQLRDPDGRRNFVPIDQVVEWSRSRRSGQRTVVADEGCLRWGLCETPIIQMFSPEE